MMQIDPIDSEQQQRVIEKTHYYINLAETIFARGFDFIPVLFDLSGYTAGMYKVLKQNRLIRYNPYIFAKYYDDNLAVTVPHEVAHYITEQIYGMYNIRPHGSEWRYLMQKFGAESSVTCKYNVEGIPHRKQRKHRYRCQCDAHLLSSHRHNKVQRGQARYYCKKCKTLLSLDLSTRAIA